VFEVYDPDIEWDIGSVPRMLELGYERIYRGRSPRTFRGADEGGSQSLNPSMRVWSSSP
jgi:hypothetical protein